MARALSKKAALLGFLCVATGGCVGSSANPNAKKPSGLLFSNSSGLTWPTEGKIISHFGMRNGRMHNGIDIKGQVNSPIYAVDRGKVIFAGFMTGYGLSLIIKHEHFFSLYGHCSEIKVKKNNFVRKGQTIASTGSTGNASTDHLHFEYHNANKEALNPMNYLEAQTN